jgi:GAF domain-containing protein
VSAAIEQLVEQLLTELNGQRVTVRVGSSFPVRYEALAPGTGSLRDDTTDLTKQPVPRVLEERGGQVVQEDSAAEFPDDAGFHEMRERYGGMRAQIVTGCYRDGELVALLSIHDLRAPRVFGEAERGHCRAAATAIARMLDGQA